MANHKVIIAQTGGSFVVRQGKLNVRAGDTVSWKAIGTDAHIFFPTGQPLGCKTLDVAAGTESQALTVRDVAQMIYPYSVFCDTPNAFAQGGSDPELIVGP